MKSLDSMSLLIAAVKIYSVLVLCEKKENSSSFLFKLSQPHQASLPPCYEAELWVNQSQYTGPSSVKKGGKYMFPYMFPLLQMLKNIIFLFLISGFSGMNQWRLGVGRACVHKWIFTYWATDWVTRMTYKPNYLWRAMHINFRKQKAAVLCSVSSHPWSQKEQFAENCCARAGKKKK